MIAGDTYLFEQHSLMLDEITTRRTIVRLKQHGAVCKFVNNKFFWYLPKSDIQPQEEINDEIFNNNTGFVGSIYEFQKDGILKLLNNNRFILSYDTGLGKTIMTIYAISYLLTNTADKRDILIIAPKQVLNQWKLEFSQHLPSISVKVYGEDGFDDARVKIISYTRLRLSINDFSTKSYLAVVFDEANYIKNMRALQTKASTALTARYKWLLTATPIKNSPFEIYSLLNVLDLAKYKFGKYREFLDRYAVYTYVAYLNRDVISGFNMELFDELKSKVSDVIFGYKKSDEKVFNELNSKFDYIEQNVNITPTENQLDNNDILNYKIELVIKNLNTGEDINSFDNIDEALVEGEIEYNTVLPYFTAKRLNADGVEFLALSTEKLSDGLITTDEENPKMNELLNIINDISNEHKIVVFTVYEKVAERIYEVLKQNNIEALIITGSNGEPVEVLNEFKNSKINVLVSTDVFKFGVNMQFVDYIINYDLPWTYSEYEQRIGRVNRIGRTNIPIIINLICKGLIDEYIFWLIKKKKEFNDLSSSTPPKNSTNPNFLSQFI